MYREILKKYINWTITLQIQMFIKLEKTGFRYSNKKYGMPKPESSSFNGVAQIQRNHIISTY